MHEINAMAFHGKRRALRGGDDRVSFECMLVVAEKALSQKHWHNKELLSTLKICKVKRMQG